MIGEFTYESAGFNPTWLLIWIAVAVAGGILFFTAPEPTRTGKFHWRMDLGGFMMMFGVMFAVMLGVLAQNVVVMEGKNDARRDQAAVQLLEDSGYDNIKIDYTEWTGSLDGQYAEGSIAHVSGNDYIIYKED